MFSLPGLKTLIFWATGGVLPDSFKVIPVLLVRLTESGESFSAVTSMMPEKMLFGLSALTVVSRPRFGGLWL